MVSRCTSPLVFSFSKCSRDRWGRFSAVPVLVATVARIARVARVARVATIALVARSFAVGLVLVAGPSQSHALEATVSTVAIETEGDFFVEPFLATDHAQPKILVVTYNDDDSVSDFVRRVQLYEVSAEAGLVQQALLDVELPRAMQLVDTTVRGRQPLFVGYKDQHLYSLDVATGEFEQMLMVPSIFRGVNRSSSPNLEFLKDLNDDERDDVILADFSGWQVSSQLADGTYAEARTIGPAPFMAVGSERYTVFRAEEPYFLDSNLDGKQDVAFWIDGDLSVHLQTVDGTFRETPETLVTGHSDVLEGFYSLSIGVDEDNPDGIQRVVESIDDIDGDGLADLIVQSISGDGIFGKETQIEFYLGAASDTGSLSFPKNPTTIIASNGIQALSERVDLNGDGMQEVIVTSIDIGIGMIIRALLTRSFSMDVGIYTLSQDGYPTAANVDRSITAKFDLTNGELFVPVVLPADVTGDGKLDWLVQDSETKLRVYEGVDGPKLFSTQYSTHKLELPRNPQDFRVVDVDGDGRDELLLKHGKDDAKSVSLVRFQ